MELPANDGEFTPANVLLTGRGPLSRRVVATGLSRWLDDESRVRLDPVVIYGIVAIGHSAAVTAWHARVQHDTERYAIIPCSDERWWIGWGTRSVKHVVCASRDLQQCLLALVNGNSTGNCVP